MFANNTILTNNGRDTSENLEASRSGPSHTTYVTPNTINNALLRQSFMVFSVTYVLKPRNAITVWLQISFFTDKSRLDCSHIVEQ